MKMIIFTKMFGPQEYDHIRPANAYTLGTYAKVMGDPLPSNKYPSLIDPNYWVMSAQNNRGQRVWIRCQESTITNEVKTQCLLLGVPV
jgi:hypothetical protein